MGSPSDQVLFLTHGICAIIAFAFCIPVAVTSAMTKNIFNFDLCHNQKAWFVIHYSMNLLALVLTIVVFGLAVYVYERRGIDHFKYYTHEWVGLLTMILVVLQVTFAFFRPKKIPSQPKPAVVENEDDESGMENPTQEKQQEEKTSSLLLRSIWEIFHRVSALGILALGLYQIISGLDLYEKHYGVLNWTTAFWIVVGCLYAIMVSIITYAKLFA